MKILTLTHEYPPVGGGGGRVAQSLAEGLAARDHQVRVLTSGLAGLPPEETRSGVQIKRLNVARKDAFRASFLSMALYVVRAVLTGLRLIWQERPDCIHVHFAVPAGAAAWALHLFTGVPYILTVHMGDIPGGVPSKTAGWFRWVRPLTPPIWRAAARVISVSSHGKRLAARHYPDVSVSVIPNGVDVDAIPKSGYHQPPRVAFVGRFMTEKNPLGFVAALARLRDLPWDAVMVGDGPLMPDVRRALAENGLTERVRLTGWVTPEQALEEIVNADILVIPSFSEGLPVVAVQALAAGVAIVASRVGSLDDVVVHGKNGFLVDEIQPDEFARYLRYFLVENTLLQDAKKHSLLQASEFDLQRIIGQYETHLLSILSS
jgi:glycosyltransferase involved in cell wall biosynthesis